MHALKQEAIFNIHYYANAMMVKNYSKNRVKKAIFGLFFAILSIFSLSFGLIEDNNTVYAEPVEEVITEVEATDDSLPETNDAQVVESVNGSATNTITADEKGCKDSLGGVGWWVCPGTGKIAEAVDWLYDKIENILVINPVEIKDGSPVYEVWKYFKGITNIVFIIFLLIVVYSQITGLGITNYGVKKVLPKLIVAAILVNLSFIVCSLAVDLSNIIGGGLRGVFTSIAEATYSEMELGASTAIPLAEVYSALAGGSMLTVGGVAIAIETGAIWMLIPTILGAIFAVISGLITIALRQAVVILLIMIAPLAIVSYMLPNTEQWFKKWKQLFIKMLVFYPAFSLLFGASSLAGFAIVTSATDGFGVILGIAVQVFPLFFSWSLMKMSGTFLSTVNAKIRSLGARPLAATRSWAESHRESTRQKYLASNNVYTPSLYLRQYLSDRKIHREEETKENAEIVKNRGLAYSVKKHYKDFDKSLLNDEGEEAYANQARNAGYQNVLIRHKANMNKGFAYASKEGTAQRKRLDALDKANVEAFDRMKMEMARAEIIDYDNAVGFHKRMENAMNAHMDELHWDKKDDKGNLIYERHFASKTGNDFINAKARYEVAKEVMEGDLQNVQYTAAYASHAYDTQAKIIQTKFQKYFELTPPTRDVRYRLEEFSKFSEKLSDGTFTGKAVDNIDAIISGLRVLNQRGDTDFLKDIMDDVLDKKYGGVELGTHASQALASFLMFEVKDNDPYLRRFGKYINLETARRFDKNERQKETVDYDEYVKGYHIEPDGTKMFAKKDMAKLMEGTSLDGIERTALDNYDASLRKAYTDENGVLDVEAYREKRKEVDKSTAPQFISANLKYLSGSEQIVSAVKSKTGFMSKQDKKTGRYDMVPIWEDEKEIKELFKKYENDPDKWNDAKNDLIRWYRNQTLQYLQDQTPAQILSLRSDYKEPLLEHLSAAYLLDDNGEIDEEKMRRHNEMLDAIDNDDFGETDPDEIKKKRKAAKEALRMDEAGKMFRELLYRKGKLAQIEKSKRSGAANNAKDWVRELLLLDSENGLRKWILDRDSLKNKSSIITQDSVIDQDDEKKNKMTVDYEQQKRQDIEKRVERQKQKEAIKKMLLELREQQKREADPNLAPDKMNISVYSSDDIARFTNQIDDIWHEMRDNDDEDGLEEFFKVTHDYIVNNLGAESFVAKMYEKYHQDNPDEDMYELRTFLIELLNSLLDD